MSLRVGFVGAGWAADQHAASLAALGEAPPVAVTDVDPARRDSFAGRWGARPAAEVTDLLTDRLDAAVVTTPTGRHAAAVLELRRHGVAVFVEKPLSVTISDAREIVATADRTGVPLAVGYQWRAVPVLDLLTQELGDGRIALLVSQGIGITQARSWFTDPQLSTGLLGERGSHHLDLHGHLAGPIVEVHAVRGPVRTSGAAPVGDADVLSVIGTHDSGAVSMTALVWASEQHVPEQSLRVVSERGNHLLRLDPDFVLTGGSTAQPVDERGTEVPFVGQLARFLRAVRAGDPEDVFCTAAQAAATVLAVEAGGRSLASGRPERVGQL